MRRESKLAPLIKSGVLLTCMLHLPGSYQRNITSESNTLNTLTVPLYLRICWWSHKFTLYFISLHLSSFQLQNNSFFHINTKICVMPIKKIPRITVDKRISKWVLYLRHWRILVSFRKQVNDNYWRDHSVAKDTWDFSCKLSALCFVLSGVIIIVWHFDL